jgi:hypothetical protein
VASCKGYTCTITFSMDYLSAIGGGRSFPEVKFKPGAIFLAEIKACDDAAAAVRSWLPRVGDRCAQREGYCCIGHAGARSAHEGGKHNFVFVFSNWVHCIGMCTEPGQNHSLALTPCARTNWWAATGAHPFPSMFFLLFSSSSFQQHSSKNISCSTLLAFLI